MDEIGLFEQLLTSFLSFFAGLINLFPDFDVSLGDNITNGINTFIDILATSSFALPVTDILIIISAVAVIRIANFTIFLVNWIIQLIAELIP